MRKKGNFFLDVLPPPDYLTMPVFCVDLSDRSLKYIELGRRKGTPAILNYGIFPVESGVVERGVIKEKDKLVALLRNLRGKIKTKYIVASLPEEKVFLSLIKFPVTDEENLREALALQLDEHIPMPAKDAIFDFDIIKGRKKETDKFFHINLAAFERSFVESYRDVFVEAGFMPLAFEMEAQAFARSVVPRDEEENVMVIDFGRTRATFAIVNEAKVQFAITVAVSGEEIEKAFMENLNIDRSQVEKAKREIGFRRQKGNEKIFDAILPTVSAIKEEAARHADYWESHHEANEEKVKISKFILCGGESTLAGLPEFLSYQLKKKVELGDPWTNVLSFDDHIPEIERKDSLAYSTVIGLALRQLNP
ncbi:hypothetical protein C4572_03580 [Candidatus Parcubacteria bacterium]|nr:MAG: hypothetical protein C4572_03580 [Candidatus Parcubacteria bacterium]